jgi:WD40-like Beta Propeller Repeat
MMRARRFAVSRPPIALVVASLALCLAPTAATAETCPNEQLRREDSSTRLPECRAWEQVSPADKVAGQVAFPVASYPGSPAAEPGLEAVAPSGDAVAYWSYAAFAESPTGLLSSYRSLRTPQGWFTKSWGPAPQTPHPSLLNAPAVVRDATSDLTVGFVQTSDALSTLDQDDHAFDVYSVDTSGNPSWLSQPDSSGPDTAAVNATYEGHSADGRHVLFETPEALVPAAAGQLAGNSLYDRTNGQTELVGARSDGSIISPCGSALGGAGGVLAGSSLPLNGAVSSDGSHVFFTAPDPTTAGEPSCSEPSQVYARIDGVTTDISATQRNPATPDPGGTQPAYFQGATPDGSKVLFISNEALTDSAIPGTSEMLYEYDVASGALTLITPAGRVSGVTGMSADGSVIYFYKGLPSRQLYVYRAGAGLAAIATFALTDPNSDATAPLDGSYPAARVSPDGRYLAFLSRDPITGYDSSNPSCGNGVGRCTEVYLYGDSTNTTVCVSCNPSGAPASGDAGFGGDGSRASSGVSYPPVENLMPNGRVVYDTPDALVPQDTNGRNDVYGWKDGVNSLLSDGKAGVYGSVLFGIGQDGHDVFFGTTAGLVSQDTDHGDTDIYDARIDGGFPAAPQVSTCSGDQCQGSPSSPPSLSTPLSTGLFASGSSPTAPSQARTNVVLSVGAISKKAQRAFGSGRRLALALRVSTGGTATATASARIGAHVRTVASASKRIARSGPLTIDLSLAKFARARLAHAGKLRVTIVVAFTSAKPIRVVFTLTASTSARGL